MLGRFRTAFALSLAFVALSPFEGTAQAQPLLERFDPAERGSRFFAADSLELDGDLRFSAGVVMAYGSRLRTFRQSDAPAGGGREDSRLVENSFWLHPGAAVVLAPGVRFALDVPIALQTGSGATLDGTFYPAPSSPAFGDVRGSFDLRLFGPPRDRTGADGPVIAAGVSAYLPTGASSAYASDDFARVAFKLAGAWQAGPLLAAARVGYMYRKDDLVFAGVRLGGEGTGVLAVGYHRGALVVGPELHGSTVLKTAFDRRSTPLEVLVGAHVKVGDVQLGAGLGTAVVTGLGAPGFRGVLSLEWVPGGIIPSRDRDGDGVMDADDTCPDVPGPADAGLGARGCPPAPAAQEPAPPPQPPPVEVPAPPP